MQDSLRNKRDKFSFRVFMGFLLNPGIIFLYGLLLVSYFLLIAGDAQDTDLSKATKVMRGFGSLKTLEEIKKISFDDEGNGLGKAISGSSLKSKDAEKDLNRLGVELVDQSIESGIEFTHRQGGKKLTAINDVIGSGACTADYDLDGYLDIYVVNGSGYSHHYGKKWWWSKSSHNVLYRNMGDGTFKDSSEVAGVGKSAWGMGCVFADYDNDGYPDLYVTNFGANILYHNNGDSTFTDVTDKAGVGDGGWGTGIAWADYDNDGDLDLYVVNYVVFDKTMTPAEPNSAFKIIKPLLMSSNLFDSQSNVLYRNNGDGTFTDVTKSSGVGNSPGRGMGAVFFDYDDDGYQDIYVTNDKSRNVLFHNMGDGSFTEVGGVMGVDTPLSGMGVTIGDYDNDGDFDIFSTHIQSETNILYQNRLADTNDRGSYNRGGFVDITVDAGLGEDVGVGYFGWSTEFLDIDNDGYLDIFVANGHGVVDFDNPQTTVAQKNQVFRNNKDGTFTDISVQLGKGFNSFGSSRGMIVGDFDNDGDYDFFINNNNGRSQFLENRNSTGNHWINIRLQGTKSNRDGIGAKITLHVGLKMQTRSVLSGSGYLSQSDKRVLFGLGNADVVDILEVMWPSGLKQLFRSIKGNQFIVIVEGDDEVLIDKKATRSIKPKIKRSSRNSARIEERVRRKSKTDELAAIVKSKIVNNEIDATLRIEAINALSRITGDRSLEVLLHLLENEDKEDMAAVVRALGEMGRAEAVPPLLILMKNEKSRTTRLEIVQALGKLSSDRSLELLLEALLDDDVDFRRAASLSLSELFKKEEKIFKSSMLNKRGAVTALIKALDDPDIAVRRLVLRSLGLSESYRTVLPVINAFKDTSTLVRGEAVRTAGLLRDRRAVEPLLKLLNDTTEEDRVRVQSLIALKRLESEVVLEPLIKMIGSGRSDERLKAVSVLYGLLQNKESIIVNKAEMVPILEEGIDDETPEVRIAVLKTVRSLKGFDLSGIIINGLGDPDLDVKREAIRAAIDFNQKETLEKVKALLGSSDKEIRIEAIRALAMLPTTHEDIEYLKGVVNDEANDDEVHLVAIEALILVDSDVAIKVIEERIESADPPGRIRLIERLGTTGNPKAIGLLISHTDTGKSVDEQVSAVNSLMQFVRKREVYSVLLRAFMDKDRSLLVRKAALNILLEWSKSKNEVAKLFPFITKALKFKSDPLRLEVIESFMDIGAREMVPILLMIVTDDSETTRIRRTALKVLMNTAPQEAFPAVEELLNLNPKAKERFAG